MSSKTPHKLSAEKKEPKRKTRKPNPEEVVKQLFAAQKPPTLRVTDTKDGMVVSPEKSLESREFARTMLGNRPVRTTIVQDVTSSSGAGTALAVAVPADVTLASGFSSWFNLFDEMRCSEVSSRFIVVWNAAGTLADTATIMWAANFDPMQSAAPGSIVSVISASRHLGPSSHHAITGTSMASGQQSQGLVSVTRKGHYELSSGHLTQGMLPPNSGGVQSVSPVGGDWVSTSDAAAVVGYFKYYGEALGGSNTWSVRAFHVFSMEFRFRG